METKARTLINKFKKVRSRNSLKLAALHQDEDDNLPNDLIQLKYLADAGLPEAILAYARLCFIGRYVPVNKPQAFTLVSKLLEKVSTPDRLEWVRDNLNDGFIAKVIQYRYQHQYGTAHAHKWWVWANQARLNFTRIAVIAKVGALDEVTKHPSYASLAFVMFTVRFFGDLFVLINTAYRDLEERKLQGNFKWFLQFIKKDDKYLRYLNDIVWACLGVVGFTMFMVGLEGLAPAIPLVLGYLFDVGVEIYRAVLQYKNLTKEAAFLGDQIEECIAKIAILESAPMTAADEKERTCGLIQCSTE
jgi:hypothetical protein